MSCSRFLVCGRHWGWESETITIARFEKLDMYDPPLQGTPFFEVELAPLPVALWCLANEWGITRGWFLLGGLEIHFVHVYFFAVYTGAVSSAWHFCLFIPVFLSQMSVPCTVVSGWTRQLLSLIKTPIFSLHISQMLSWYMTLHCCEQKCRFSFLCSKITDS